jgi:hypothetical protein
MQAPKTKKTPTAVIAGGSLALSNALSEELERRQIYAQNAECQMNLA